MRITASGRRTSGRIVFTAGFGMSASVDFTEADSANEIATRIVDALNALPMPVPASERPVFEVEADGSTVSQVRPPVTPATIRALVFADLGKYGNVGGT